MLARDFHVDCAVTLYRFYVFFVIEVGTRVLRPPWRPGRPRRKAVA
jgi:hypothetical protein